MLKSDLLWRFSPPVETLWFQRPISKGNRNAVQARIDLEFTRQRWRKRYQRKTYYLKSEVGRKRPVGLPSRIGRVGKAKCLKIVMHRLFLPPETH